MNFKNILKLTCCIFIFTLTSCSSDDDQIVVNDTSSITDKWYYDTNEFAADIYFNSNGTYQQRTEAIGMVFESFGDWSWLDEENGLMKIDNVTGQSQVASELWFQFTNIQENTVTIEQSLDGNTYFAPVDYQDTDPAN
ncbi:hypothetical protein [uncultured Kordia sp.]|uniref:hypothetical protein n=1 Tax=uncultured Kordia sp. TaxID=507699 RepID=UPI00262B790C|nr:hypothetical protein [uncultured Kordia sp.]